MRVDDVASKIFSPRHRMPLPFGSSDQGFKCVSMMWRAISAHHVIGCRYHLLKRRGFEVCVDDVAISIWRALVSGAGRRVGAVGWRHLGGRVAGPGPDEAS
jgi:hypothetical protein